MIFELKKKITNIVDGKVVSFNLNIQSLGK